MLVTSGCNEWQEIRAFSDLAHGLLSINLSKTTPWVKSVLQYKPCIQGGYFSTRNYNFRPPMLCSGGSKEGATGAPPKIGSTMFLNQFCFLSECKKNKAQIAQESIKTTLYSFQAGTGPLPFLARNVCAGT